MDIELIAKICHNVNKAYCECHDDFCQPDWESAPRWQKDSAINGVKYQLENDATPEQLHESWLKQKLAEGWVWGKVKDAKAKTHPCIVNYEFLPKYQKTKDFLFKAIVDSFKH